LPRVRAETILEGHHTGVAAPAATGYTSGGRAAIRFDLTGSV
jgi:hypothetical protein